MKINISKVNQEEFYIKERTLDQIGETYLIVPKVSKHSWSDNDRHLRSLLVDKSGEIVSCSFFKFHNYGEVPQLDRLTDSIVSSGNCYFSEKLDGSLIIRSVYKGKVILRTRGSHSLGEFEERVMSLVSNNYPGLLNPELYNDRHLLFEFTSPENIIVLKYEEPSLNFIGSMHVEDYGPQFFSNPNYVFEVCSKLGTPGVTFHNLSNDSSEIISAVSSWKDSEGIVIWAKMPNGYMHLTKIKAEEYRRIHSLRFQMTKAKVHNICAAKNFRTEEQLKEYIYSIGLDWEVFVEASEYFKEYLEKLMGFEKDVEKVILQMNEHGVHNLKSRKDKALLVKDIAPSKELFGIGILYALDNKDYLLAPRSMSIGVSIKRLKEIISEFD